MEVNAASPPRVQGNDHTDEEQDEDTEEYE